MEPSVTLAASPRLAPVHTAPGLQSSLSTLVVLPAAVAEFAFLGWLLVKGARP